jgi:hypothetical protein
MLVITTIKLAIGSSIPQATANVATTTTTTTIMIIVGLGCKGLFLKFAY